MLTCFFGLFIWQPTLDFKAGVFFATNGHNNLMLNLNASDSCVKTSSQLSAEKIAGIFDKGR
jgi:hypothetical protein